MPLPTGPTDAAGGPIPPVVALLDYSPAVRDLVLDLKVRNRRRALGPLADALAAAAHPPPGAVVTWAPTAPTRRRSRGYDQAELLARALARRWHRPVRCLLLRHPGRPQAGLDAARRRGHPGFEPARRVPPRVVVVDDVVTTGATLAAAAEALHRGGALSVTAVVIARAGGAAGPTIGAPSPSTREVA